jgi:DNA-binding transcriptional ArsR family regulator
MSTEQTSASPVDSLAGVFKALGDPTRLRIVEILRAREGEVTGTQLAEEAEISLALLCYHADTLVDSGIVRKRKEGQTSYWALDRDALAAALAKLVP